jgi:hypothetical protein
MLRKDWVVVKVLGGWYGKRIAIALVTVAVCLAGCDSTPPLGTGNPLNGSTTTTKGTGGEAAMPSPAPTPTPDPPYVDERIAGGPTQQGPSTCAPLAPADPTITSSTQNTDGCPCTRRPGPGHSFQCAEGTGESSTATIGPEGGQLTLLGAQGKSSGVEVQINFPPGAVAEPTIVTLTETTIPPPKDLTDFSPVYLLEPRGLVLAKLAPVRVPWGSAATSIGRDLAIYERAETGTCEFTPLGDNYLNAGFNQGSIDHLGYFVVGLPRTSADAACP